MSALRAAAVAGRWYPGTKDALAREVDRHLDAAGDGEAIETRIAALIAPHAGLMYSGPVAAYAYRQLRSRAYDVAVLVGPSHFAAFDGVAVDLSGGFETPLGPAEIDRECADALMRGSPIIREHPGVHAREHSLEMQLPFLKRVAPETRIVALLMGQQTRETAHALAEGLAATLTGRRALLVASTDLSHYHDAGTASRMDSVVIERIAQDDVEGLQRELDVEPDHACGGGPTVAVMAAARLLGANRATILRYGDSGDVSGDKTSVVGYLAAAISHDDAS
jgi:hypothetical protein